MTRRGCLIRILILILIGIIILAVRVRAPRETITLSIADLATQIETNKNVAALFVSQDNVFVTYTDPTREGVATIEKSTPIVDQLKAHGVSDEELANITIAYASPPNPFITFAGILLVLAFIVGFVFSPIISIVQWWQKRRS